MSESFYVGALKDVEQALLQNNLKLKDVGGISRLQLESICTLIDLVEKAYFAGWRAGYITDVSDSSEFNSCEDWLESDIREELKKYHRTGKSEDNE